MRRVAWVFGLLLLLSSPQAFAEIDGWDNRKEIVLGSEFHIWTTHNNSSVGDQPFLAVTVPVISFATGGERFLFEMSAFLTWGITEFFFEPEIGVGVTVPIVLRTFGVQAGGTVGGLMMNHFSFRGYARLYADIPLAPLLFARLSAGYEARTSLKVLDYFKHQNHMTMGAHGFVVGLSLVYGKSRTHKKDDLAPFWE